MKDPSGGARQRSPTKTSEHITLLHNLVTGRWALHTDLTEGEIYAIGFVSVQWAQLEHGLLISSSRMAKRLKIEMPKNATSLAFQTRLRTWYGLAAEVKSAQEKKRLLSLHGAIANVEDKRHKVVHGLWDWEMSRPLAVRASSFRPGVSFDEGFNFQKLLALGETIGEIAFDLIYPRGLPSGFFGQPYMSRRAAAMFAGDGPLPGDLTIAEPYPAKR